MAATYESLLAGVSPPGLYRLIGHDDPAELAVASGWAALSLDTSLVRDRASFYAEVSQSWGLPEWFGNNLDALFDSLADITAVPTILIWDGFDRLHTSAPELTAAVIGVFSDRVALAPAFAVLVRGEVRLSGFAELS